MLMLILILMLMLMLPLMLMLMPTPMTMLLWVKQRVAASAVHFRLVAVLQGKDVQ